MAYPHAGSFWHSHCCKVSSTLQCISPPRDGPPKSPLLMACPQGRRRQVSATGCHAPCSLPVAQPLVLPLFLKEVGLGGNSLWQGPQFGAKGVAQPSEISASQPVPVSGLPVPKVLTHDGRCLLDRAWQGITPSSFVSTTDLMSSIARQRPPILSPFTEGATQLPGSVLHQRKRLWQWPQAGHRVLKP